MLILANVSDEEKSFIILTPEEPKEVDHEGNSGQGPVL
jgi:hypothetical protein